MVTEVPTEKGAMLSKIAKVVLRNECKMKYRVIEVCT